MGQCTALQAQNESAFLKGRVINQWGQVLPKAQVRVLPLIECTFTNQNGEFSLQIKPGRYELIIGMLGKEEFRQEIQMEPRNNLTLSSITLKDSSNLLEEVVVTGSLYPQSLKQTVYQTRVISQEQIQLRGGTNLQAILNTELGIRFSNDLILGTTDIELLGMSGQNVKILLDGVPMTDRGATRESLGQIDINQIERIEIVEGPMSVMYGTDALAGVINIISKRSDDHIFKINARLQEETVAHEYQPFTSSGVHNASLSLGYKKNGWGLEGSLSRNNFGGWQGDKPGRAKAWMPKEQWLGSAGIGYNNQKIRISYRLNGTDESLRSLGDVNTNTQMAADKYYLTKRWFHQLHSSYQISDRLKLGVQGAFTDYSRKTQSSNLDVTTGNRILSMDAGAQDRSTFQTTFGRGTVVYQFSKHLTLLGGIDFTQNQSKGARIQVNAPSIRETALYISPEFRISRLKVRPGLRFLKNSQYTAPPVVPSINSKLQISKWLDLRMGYARGFRSPDLRELYFSFFDASHSIQGNPNLKAEHSNSFNASLTAGIPFKSPLRITSTLSGFYNHFQNLIGTAIRADNPAITTYLNIEKFKTTGASWNNQLFFKQVSASIGFQYIGRYNRLGADALTNGESNNFNWTPEVNSNISYQFKKTETTVGISFKHTGKQPLYESPSDDTYRLINRAAYNMADLTFTQKLGWNLKLNGGIRNVFNVTSINSGSALTGGRGHQSTADIPLAYGRSFFLGLAYNWAKINQ